MEWDGFIVFLCGLYEFGVFNIIFRERLFENEDNIEGIRIKE